MSSRGRRTPKIAIIGDRFMSPSVFETAIHSRCRGPLDIRAAELPWPDRPMMHGYAEPGM